MIKNNFDIGITTFSLRLHFLTDLLGKLRRDLNLPNNIYVCINGEKDGQFNEQYRKDVLALCASYDNVFPIFFVEMRGLSKMWNTLVVHSTKPDVLLLNDDINITGGELFDVVSTHVESPEYYGFSKINDTFSHFVVNRFVLDRLGYFDERLLGFGEEDGDISWRLIQDIGQPPARLWAGGVQNIVSDIRHEHVKPGIGKYSLFNREFIYGQKYSFSNTTSGIRGMFDGDADPLLPALNSHPYEKFFHENKHKV